LLEAKHILAELKPHAGTPKNLTIGALWTAFFVTYGKPFKQQRDEKLKAGIRLQEDYVPAKFIGLHKLFLANRDKVFAHTDFADFSDDKGRPVNSIVLRILEGRKTHLSVRHFVPDIETISAAEEMINEIISVIEPKAIGIFTSWTSKMTGEPGEVLELNAGDLSDDVFVPLGTTIYRPGNVRFVDPT
jgi:hypothetical protein